jgi:integrase
MARKQQEERKLDKIEEFFRVSREENIAVKEGKENGDSDNTYKKYEQDLKQYGTWMEKTFNIKNPVKWKNEHFKHYIDTEVLPRWRNGELSVAYEVKGMRAALEHLRYASATEKNWVFKKEIECIDKKEINEYLKHHHIKRISAASSTLAINGEEAELVLEHIKGNEEKGIQPALNSKYNDMVHDAFKFATVSGARLADAFDIKKSDIFIVDNKVFFDRSKGGKSDYVEIEEKDTEFLKELLEDPNNRSEYLFNRGRLKDGKWKEVSKDTAERYAQKIVKKAGENSGLNRDEEVKFKYRDENGKSVKATTVVHKKVTFHTGRKAFVNNRFTKYYDMSNGNLDKELEKRRQDPIVEAKYQALLERLNRNGEGQKMMEHYRNAIFMASLDSRHYRNDVIQQFYIIKNMLEAARKESEND